MLSIFLFSYKNFTLAEFWFVSSVRWHFFVFRNSVEKLCVSWALPFIECVAVWALKLPVLHTDVLKTHSSQSFSTELLESKGIDSEHLAQTYSFNLSFVKTSIEFFQTRQLFFLIFRFMVALLASSFLFYATLY